MAARFPYQLAAERLVSPGTLGWKALRKKPPAIPNPAPVFFALRVTVSPVDQATEIVPLIKTAHVNPVTHAQRNAFGKIDVVRDQQALTVTDIDNEALVTRAIIINRQQAAHEAGDLDPFPIIAFREHL
jgi:hypothetical protein